MRCKDLAFLFLFCIYVSPTAVFAGDELKLEIKASRQVSVPIGGGPKVERVNCDFPELTDLRDIAKAYSLWFGKEYLVDETVQLKVRLISPGLVTKPEALRRFQNMLAQNGLQTNEADGFVHIKAVDR